MSFMPNTFEPRFAPDTVSAPRSAEDEAAVAALDHASLGTHGVDDFEKVTGGIYLWRHEATREQVARGGGGTMTGAMRGAGKLRGWETGAIIPGDVRTTDEAMQIAGLDWNVIQVPMQADLSRVRSASEKGGDFDLKRDRYGNPLGRIDVPNMVVNVREDTGKILGPVGNGWRGPTNAESFRFFDELIDDDSAKWLAMGDIDGGKRVYGLIQWDRLVIPGGDVDEACLPLGFYSNGWDGTLSWSVTNAPFRLACTNGMTIPLPGYHRTFRLRHGASIQLRIAEARKALELSIGYFDAFQAEADRLITTAFEEQRFEAIVNDLFPDHEATAKQTPENAAKAQAKVDEKRANLLDVYRKSDDLENVRHTAWGAYNAIAAYSDWDALPRIKDEGRKAEQQLLGAVGVKATVKDQGFALLMDALR